MCCLFVTTSILGWLRGSSWLSPITYGDITLSLNEINRLCLHALLNRTCLPLSYHNCKRLHDQLDLFLVESLLLLDLLVTGVPFRTQYYIKEGDASDLGARFRKIFIP